ncbi:electron transport complex subunit RsxA [Aminipila butyrica]|uniref:Ion-translocating oxidoreductase complex subunit A n=1 Tax=Aminipila butyrica TaxID=433296 RepID=A0A858BQN6_9FIRM|nr:electron transport complex subunit RsxA [Aminipila butyrica]QIB67837.1 electron transport complex subunit RsxA [Aminipila butyrica]
MKEILMIMLSVALVNNFVLAQFLGICPFLGVSKKLDSSVGMGIAVTFVMVLATACTWPVQTFLLDKYEIEYLQTVAFILIIAALVQFLEMLLKKFIPALHRSLGVYLPLITTNCAVLGVTIMNIKSEFNFVESMANSFAAGVGFLLAMVLFSGMRQKMDNANVPKAFQGIPMVLMGAAILSLSFMGFSGVVQGIFE